MNEKKSEVRLFEVVLTGFDIADIDDLNSILESAECEETHRILGFEEVGDETKIRISSSEVLEMRRLLKQWIASYGIPEARIAEC